MQSSERKGQIKIWGQVSYCQANVILTVLIANIIGFLDKILSFQLPVYTCTHSFYYYYTTDLYTQGHEHTHTPYQSVSLSDGFAWFQVICNFSRIRRLENMYIRFILRAIGIQQNSYQNVFFMHFADSTVFSTLMMIDKIYIHPY